MKSRNAIWFAAIALGLCVSGAHAQSQQQDSDATAPMAPLPPINATGGGSKARAPIPAARGVSPAYDSQQPYDLASPQPDTNTLAGAQMFGIGSLQGTHNIFDPSLSFSELGRVTSGASTPSNLGSETIFNGIFEFDHTWSKYRFSTIYNGGGTYDQGTLSSFQPYQDLSVAQQIQLERWNLLLRDDFTVSPGASFTGTGIGGPGIIAQTASLTSNSLSDSAQAFIPNESIQTGNALRYRNSVLGQAEYSFSRRAAFTVSGSYGLLNFSDLGYISSRMINLQAGYDYQLDPANSIAILGGYGKMDYTGTLNSTTDYMASLAYGRRLTGRMAFQLSGGPEQIRSMIGTTSVQTWVAAINSALTYERRRSGVFLGYSSGLGSGSGVLLGAKSNTATAGGHYQFTRFWIGTVNGGYALNDSLVTAGATRTRFEDWFVGANIARELGPHARINFNYGVQRQNSPASCPVTSCGSTGFQQSFGMSVNWHLRPTG